MVYIPTSRGSLENLDLGLSEGRWAFPGRVRSLDLSELQLDDLVFFGVGAVGVPPDKGGPRGGGQFDGWAARRLQEAYVTRVTRLPFENDTPFWLDERDAVRWNPTIEIELLREYTNVPLAPGEALSLEATDALYRGGVSHTGKLVSAVGSRLFDESPAAVQRSELTGRRAADQQRSRGPALFVALESERLAKARVKARPETVSDPAESQLVHAYARHLRASGLTVGRVRIPLTGGGQLFADLYCQERRLLVEAKNAPTRHNIRLAIGQLFDYGRAREQSSRAVLVPDRPNDDLLDLLSRVEIDAIWRDGTGFRDTRGGMWC